jgi:uncharacterized protein YciI
MVVSDDGTQVTGTMLIIEGADRSAVMDYLQGDPYWREGLFETFSVDRWEWGLAPPAR